MTVRGEADNARLREAFPDGFVLDAVDQLGCVGSARTKPHDVASGK